MTDILPGPESVPTLVAQFESELAAARSPRDAQNVHDRFLGRKNSIVASWMQRIGTAPVDQKKQIGRWANELKQAVEARWLRYQESARDRLPAGAIDVTLPGRGRPLGHRHPLTTVRDRLEEIFTRMGFAVVEGPEVEDEWHCFDALNMPAEHPARDMQDTLYLDSPLPGLDGGAPRTLLRTHTSSMQIRYMQTHQPPIRIVVPGRVYRRDDLDLTHSPAFAQIEGLAVGEGLSLADLKGTLLAFARQMFSPGVRVRFRPSFFPYTEPSAEIDFSCWQCDGAGCPMCKKTGWIELGGCGMVHPAVFEAVGYDSEQFTGFAWGIGIERIAILRHQVEDIRLFYENDLRFLEQFPYQPRRLEEHEEDPGSSCLRAFVAMTCMRLLVSWLREFVDVQASAEEIGEGLGLRGFELAGIEPFGDGDAVIDFEITANRPDCLSVMGLAREVSALYDRPLKPVQLKGSAPSTPNATRELEPGVLRTSLGAAQPWLPSGFDLAIADPELCPRYAMAVAEVTVGDAPVWMARRLQAAGVRSINSIVDITNYVLIELGHPTHAFDLERIAGPEILVRRAAASERLTTLDGVDRVLDTEMLVIADRDRAQAVAGVMGGGMAEVSKATRTVAFESAYFKPSSVRRTSKRLGLKTEASSRFERGADINAPVVALQRIAVLLDQIGAGRLIAPVLDLQAGARDPVRLHLRRARLATVLGVRVPDPEVERILSRLGLTVSGSADGWDVIAPTSRVDLQREVDLIEEVGRHYGLDKLPATFPVVTAPAPPPDPRVRLDQLVRRVMTAAGLSEAVTFGIIEARAAEAFAGERDDRPVSLANPLSAKFDTLRPSLLPGLVDAVAHNRRHGRDDVGLFEVGTRFSRSGETRAAAVAWTGSAMPPHWSGAPREVDFFDVKGVVEQLCEVLGVATRYEPAREPFLVPGQTAALLTDDGTALGVLGQVLPSIADARGLPRQDRVFVAEVNLDRLSGISVAAGQATRSLPRYPFVVRDLSIVVSDSLPAAIIRGTIRAVGGTTPAPLISVDFFDRYQGKGIAEGSVSLSMRLTFQAPDRTLTDADVQTSIDTILGMLVREHQAVQR